MNNELNKIEEGINMSGNMPIETREDYV